MYNLSKIGHSNVFIVSIQLCYIFKKSINRILCQFECFRGNLHRYYVNICDFELN